MCVDCLGGRSCPQQRLVGATKQGTTDSDEFSGDNLEGKADQEQQDLAKRYPHLPITLFLKVNRSKPVI